MNKTKDELFQENLNCYGTSFEHWPEKVKVQFPEKFISCGSRQGKSVWRGLNRSVDELNAEWVARIESAMPVEEEPEDPRADPESDVFDPLAVVKGEVKPKRKPSKSKPNKKGK